MELIKNRSDWNQNQILIPTHKHMPLRNNAHPSDVYAIARNIINTQYHFEEEGTMFITVDLSRIKHLAEMMKPGTIRMWVKPLTLCMSTVTPLITV